MPQIRCEALFCLHNDYKNKKCGVTEETIIDVTKKGECIDYSPVTNAEYYICTGIDRKEDLGGIDLED